MQSNNMDDRTAEILARDARDVSAARADASPDVRASAPEKPEYRDPHGADAVDARHDAFADAAEREARTGAWAHVEPVGKYALDPWDVS